MAWYNIYRPKKFEDVVGQDLAKTILQKTIEKKSVRHAYLFAGSRGIGKTTLARIFAHELNSTDKIPEAAVDIIELDAASNTSIEDVRQLRESAQVPPLSGDYKIFIIDEVHMLSKPAMNALLKLLEEPPHYVVFLLATTNPEKLLPTVLSRVIEVPMSAHSIDSITKQLEKIAKSESVNVEKESLELIAEKSSGSLRDAVNMLETLSSYSLDTLDLKTTQKLLGRGGTELMRELTAILENEEKDDVWAKDFKIIVEQIESLGSDSEDMLNELLEYLLKQSILHNEYHLELVQAIVSVLQSKVPLNTTMSALTLVLHFLPKQFRAHSQTVEKKKETQPTSQTEPIIPQKKSTQDTVEVQKPLKTEDISQLLEREDVPIPLKMIPDLVIVKTDGKIILTTAMEMVLPTLKSKVTKDWLHKVTNSQDRIEVVHDTSHSKKRNQANNTKTLTKKDSHENNSTFYKVYKRTPGNISGRVDVENGPIPKPEHLEGDDNDIFELE